MSSIFVVSIEKLREMIRNMPDDAIVVVDNGNITKSIEGLDAGYLESEQWSTISNYSEVSSDDVELDGGWDDNDDHSHQRQCLIIYTSNKS